MATIDMTKTTREQRKSYERITRGAGKGDVPRSCFSQAYRNNWERIFRTRPTRTNETQANP